MYVAELVCCWCGHNDFLELRETVNLDHSLLPLLLLLLLLVLQRLLQRLDHMPTRVHRRCRHVCACMYAAVYTCAACMYVTSVQATTQHFHSARKTHAQNA